MSCWYKQNNLSIYNPSWIFKHIKVDMQKDTSLRKLAFTMSSIIPLSNTQWLFVLSSNHNNTKKLHSSKGYQSLKYLALFVSFYWMPMKVWIMEDNHKRARSWHSTILTWICIQTHSQRGFWMSYPLQHLIPT